MNIETQLKKLILDDNFTSVQNMVNEEVNLMNILRISHKELQHSNFLAWLFDPKETHGLGDYFIKEFIKLYYKENEYQDLGNTDKSLSVFDFVRLDFSDIEIKREHKNIDILILSSKNKFCILIENKIFASESKGQLTKYRKQIEKDYPDFKHKIYTYLSLEEQEISEEEQEFYIKFTYEHIVKLIKESLNSNILAIAKNTRFVLEQYLQTLNTIMNENEEIEKLAKDLYGQYKSAFDLVFKYAVPYNSLKVPNNLLELVKNENSLVPFHSSKSYVRFQPSFFYENIEKLKEKGFIHNNDQIKDSLLFLFEFRIARDYINFDFKIGEYFEQDYRTKLYELLCENLNIFNRVKRKSGTFSPSYHLAFQKKIVTRKEYSNYIEDANIENLDNLIEKRFKELIDKDLPKILNVIAEEIK